MKKAGLCIYISLIKAGVVYFVVVALPVAEALVVEAVFAVVVDAPAVEVLVVVEALPVVVVFAVLVVAPVVVVLLAEEYFAVVEAFLAVVYFPVAWKVAVTVPVEVLFVVQGAIVAEAYSAQPDSSVGYYFDYPYLMDCHCVFHCHNHHYLNGYSHF